jgi:abortive infection bacteriophage resistance protein
MQYAKRAFTIAEQAARLIDRGLVCGDPVRLEKYLANIGYYRLSAYWHPFELPTNGTSRNHHFQPDTSFDKVLKLYIFDRKLRLLVIEAIERIEVAVRTRWATALAMRHGSHAHMEAALFRDPIRHSQDLEKIATELGKSNEPFVVHYRNQYEEPPLPPIWAIVETMTLGTLSRWFKNTCETAAKKEVAQALAMPNIEVLEQVLHTLTPIRNICAHHGRLWNRRFPMALPVIRRLQVSMVAPDATHHQARHLFNYLVVLSALMNALNQKSSWTRRVMEFVETLDDSGRRSMGFPADWRARPVWNI